MRGSGVADIWCETNESGNGRASINQRRVRLGHEYGVPEPATDGTLGECQQQQGNERRGQQADASYRRGGVHPCDQRVEKLVEHRERQSEERSSDQAQRLPLACLARSVSCQTTYSDAVLRTRELMPRLGMRGAP